MKSEEEEIERLRRENEVLKKAAMKDYYEHQKMLDEQADLIQENMRLEEELWKLQKGIDPKTGKMWLTKRMEKEAKEHGEL